MNNKTSKQYTIKADKLGTFQWYVDSLGYLHYFGISTEDMQKLDNATNEIQSILNKFKEQA